VISRRDFVLLLSSSITAPGALRAQQKAMPVIGYLSSQSAEVLAPILPAFREGLKEAGYVEGRNVAMEFAWAAGQYDKLPALAEDLVRREVSVIVASGGAVRRACG
jgi:putative tryptophan/tyrosine transport system substrate-binding protein